MNKIGESKWYGHITKQTTGKQYKIGEFILV